MATQEQLQEDTKNYSDAFNEPETPPVEQSEDDAFGLTPEAPVVSGDESGEGTAPAVAVVIESGSGEAPAAEDAPPVDTGANIESGAAPEGGEAAPGEGVENIDVEKERQRLKSWEGRLKALQAQLDSKGEASESPAEEAAETSGEQAAEQESGSESPSLEQAVQNLSEDFGPEFVQMIQAIARGEAAKAAGEQVGEVGKTVKAIIEDINDSKAKAHFEKIFDAHPDFMEIADSPEFAEWLSQNQDQKAIADTGSARDVVKMLNAFKESKVPAATTDEVPPTDDAEGVRSTGLRLPDAPSAAPDDFQGAWDEFPD